MIDGGVDVWNGQPHNDKEMLYKTYGDKITLGMPLPVLTPESTDEEINKAAKDAVAKYAPGFPEKPVILSGFGMNPKFTPALYRESREAFYKMM